MYDKEKMIKSKKNKILLNAEKEKESKTVDGL